MPKNTVLELINKSAPSIDIVKGIIEEMLSGEYRYFDLLVSLTKMLRTSSLKTQSEVSALLTEAVKKLKNNMGQNDVNAMLFLGAMSEWWLGCDVDYDTAITLFDKAIDLACASAMNDLAMIYLYDQSGYTDHAKAIALFEKSLVLGNEVAKKNIKYFQRRKYAQDYLKALWSTLNAGANVSQSSLNFMSKSKTIKQAIVNGFLNNTFEIKNKLHTLESMLGNDEHPLTQVLKKDSIEYKSLKKYCKTLIDEQKAIASSEISDHLPLEIVQHLQYFLLGNPSAQADLDLQYHKRQLECYLRSHSHAVEYTYDLFNTPHIIGAFVSSLSCSKNQSSHLLALWLLKSIQAFGSLDNPKSVTFASPKVLSLLKHLSHCGDFISSCKKNLGELDKCALLRLIVNTEKWLAQGMACNDIDAFLTANEGPLGDVNLRENLMPMTTNLFYPKVSLKR